MAHTCNHSTEESEVGDDELKSRLSQQNKTKFLNKQNSINDRDQESGEGGEAGERDLALASIVLLERSQSITIMKVLKNV